MELEEIIDNYIDKTGVGKILNTTWKQDRVELIKALASLSSKQQEKNILEFKEFLLKNGHGGGNWRRLIETYVVTFYEIPIVTL